MSADFVAGYVSGAVGIVIGNPLDLLKTRIQAGPTRPLLNSQETTQSLGWTRHFDRWSALVRGTAAPILGYGALNALLFVTYNRSLALLEGVGYGETPEHPTALSLWTAGALGGLATFIVSAPTELVKCQAQVSNPPISSLQVAKDIWRTSGIRGLYLGGGVTSLRDSVGYGFYFWSYEVCKRRLAAEDDDVHMQALKVLLCGGIAGVVTWASVFPLDVIKTRVQTHTYHVSQATRTLDAETRPLLPEAAKKNRPTTTQIALEAYRSEGIAVFFRGLGVCSARAFIVNAVQWAIYEWMMNVLSK
ncbi:hypothetical protein AMS68_001513 [Peltaster fructicola]|uniref:Mitochondrial thiamine pyrophosphate carrier 1 n=1 Tax=Peltaster fructicola TaxID=286661 RepID=A0A6H0XMR1_9PEZI|nr:hypothetical protein AMS68_001513 [Peltaster fructicola]